MQSNKESRLGVGQVRALCNTSDMKRITVCNTSKYDTIETKGL